MDYTKIRDHRIRTKICELMSDMLDNPNEYGIFPTSKFMWEMESFILNEIGRNQDDDTIELLPITNRFEILDIR